MIQRASLKRSDDRQFGRAGPRIRRSDEAPWRKRSNILASPQLSPASIDRGLAAVQVRDSISIINIFLARALFRSGGHIARALQHPNARHCHVIPRLWVWAFGF